MCGLKAVPFSLAGLALLTVLMAGCHKNNYPQYPANYREYAYVTNGGSATVTQLQITVNYRSPVVSSQTTLLATGNLSFDGTDSSNPAATGQVRVK